MKTVRILLFLTLVGLGVPSGTMASDAYAIDPTHSTIGFFVKHLGLSTVHGIFRRYEGTILLDMDNPEATRIHVIIQAGSIDTALEARDNHLRQSEFLDIANHPIITFQGKGLHKAEDGRYMLTGDLTLKGVSKEIVIPVAVNGPISSPSGPDLIGLEGSLTINRQDFGVSWNKRLDQGGYVVGNDVTVNFSVEAQKQQSGDQ